MNTADTRRHSATTYTVTVGSPFEGHRDVAHFTVTVVGESAQALADHYAAEYCDSGTVSVRSSDGDRGLVARRSLA